MAVKGNTYLECVLIQCLREIWHYLWLSESKVVRWVSPRDYVEDSCSVRNRANYRSNRILIWRNWDD